MSEMGHLLPIHSAAVPTNVRYGPNSDHSSLKADVRLKSPGLKVTSDKALYRSQSAFAALLAQGFNYIRKYDFAARTKQPLYSVRT